MTMTKNFTLLALILTLFACGKEEEKTTMPEETQEEVVIPVEEEKVKINQVSFENLNNWGKDDLKDAMHAFFLSCDKIALSDKEYLSDSFIKIPTMAYKDVCARAKMLTPIEYRNFIEKNFVPYQVTYNDSDIGQFTSYYETYITASKNKTDVYRYPVYGRPYDMFEANLKDFDENLPNAKISGRVVGQKFLPYYTRDEISKTYMKAPVILWANSAVDNYIMQIQGSAVAFLDDGTQVRVSYDSNNGHKFTGIGKILLQHRLIRPDKASMMDIKEWLKSNPDQGKDLMNQNKRFVFSRLSYEDGPIGAQGVPLTAGRSLAVDPDYIPLGSLIWLETAMPKYGNVEKLVVAQDVGSAIKGPIRGDYFWGTGADEVLELAGKMNSTGRYFILVPKSVETDN